MRLPDGLHQEGGGRAVLVHLAAGIGNLVLATPLLAALYRMGYEVDLLLHADYPQAAGLFADWAAVRRVHAVRFPPGERYARLVPAVPPFYWSGLRRPYAGRSDCVARPPDALFYHDEQAWYLTFAEALGWPHGERPAYTLPVAPSHEHGVTQGTLVLAPGCKTGEMAAKRWPHFAALAERFADVAVVGTAHPHQGEAVRAYVVRVDGSDIDEDVVIEHCTRLLARYKCPTKVLFVDELPKNATGKLLRRELRGTVLDQ